MMISKENPVGRLGFLLSINVESYSKYIEDKIGNKFNG